MQVSAITSNLFQSNKKQKNYTTPISNNLNAAAIQNNNLIDLNYGNSLIKLNKISFKGTPKEVLITLNKKVAVAFNELKDGHILLIGRDFETARAALAEPLKKMTTLITKYLFIQDSKLKSSIAIKANVENYGVDELINLGPNLVSIKKLATSTDSQPDLLKRGERICIDNWDYVSTGNPEYGFHINKDEIDGISVLPQGLIKEFDLSKMNDKGIAEINIKNLESLTSSRGAANPAKKLTFADVGGQDEAIEDIKRKILFQIKYPNYFRTNINKGAHGALFVGPPGNGKSLAALAAANEADVKFFGVNPQLLKSKWVGESEANIHAQYEEYRKNQPCIVFYDEANAIFPKRTGGGNIYAESESELHYDEMSQLEKEGAKVFFIAATNHPEQMDEAALRRFDTKIEFSNLDTVERCKAVFGIYTKSTQIQDFNSDVFMRKLLKAEVTGDNIANLTINAQLNATERLGIFDAMAKGTFLDNPDFKLVLTGEDFNQALEKLTSQRKMVQGYSKEKHIRGFGV